MIHNRTSKGVPLTMRNIKTFIKNNRESLLISELKKWGEPANDGEPTASIGFKTPKKDTAHPVYTLGIKGAWFMGHGCDYYYSYSANGKTGYEVFNGCAHFVLAIEAPLWRQRCSVTGRGIDEGFVFNGEVFANQQGVSKEVKRCGWKSYQEAYDAGNAYWTSWANEPPQFREEADGVLTKITQDLHI